MAIINKGTSTGANDLVFIDCQGLRTQAPFYVGYCCNEVSTHLGRRYSNIEIPQGATIVSASLNFSSNTSSPCATGVSLKIYADDTDNSSVFSNGSDFLSRSKTTAYSTCVFELTIDDFPSIDIKNIIQEIVNREGWESGNAINLMVFDNGCDTGAQFSINSTESDELIIEYSISNNVGVDTGFSYAAVEEEPFGVIGCVSGFQFSGVVDSGYMGHSKYTSILVIG
jgi:hypothetical protein